METNELSTSVERFEAAILEFGIVAACEWFGHVSSSQFTEETIDFFEKKKQIIPTEIVEEVVKTKSGIVLELVDVDRYIIDRLAYKGSKLENGVVMYRYIDKYSDELLEFSVSPDTFIKCCGYQVIDEDNMGEGL